MVLSAELRQVSGRVQTHVSTHPAKETPLDLRQQLARGQLSERKRGDAPQARPEVVGGGLAIIDEDSGRVHEGAQCCWVEHDADSARATWRRHVAEACHLPAEVHRWLSALLLSRASFDEGRTRVKEQLRLASTVNALGDRLRRLQDPELLDPYRELWMGGGDHLDSVGARGGVHRVVLSLYEDWEGGKLSGSYNLSPSEGGMLRA